MYTPLTHVLFAHGADYCSRSYECYFGSFSRHAAVCVSREYDCDDDDDDESADQPYTSDTRVRRVKQKKKTKNEEKESGSQIFFFFFLKKQRFTAKSAFVFERRRRAVAAAMTRGSSDDFHGRRGCSSTPVNIRPTALGRTYDVTNSASSAHAVTYNYYDRIHDASKSISIKHPVKRTTAAATVRRLDRSRFTHASVDNYAFITRRLR